MKKSEIKCALIRGGSLQKNLESLDGLADQAAGKQKITLQLWRAALDTGNQKAAREGFTPAAFMIAPVSAPDGSPAALVFVCREIRQAYSAETGKSYIGNDSGVFAFYAEWKRRRKEPQYAALDQNTMNQIAERYVFNVQEAP